MDINVLITPAAQIALIIGIAEVIKKLGLPKRWIPLIDLFLGLISGICVYGLHLHYDIVESIVIGLAMGLSSCGLFSGVKNTIKEE